MLLLILISLPTNYIPIKTKYSIAILDTSTNHSNIHIIGTNIPTKHTHADILLNQISDLTNILLFVVEDHSYQISINLIHQALT